MTHRELVLASTSLHRAELLRRLGVPFAAETPPDEEHLHSPPCCSPPRIAELRARAKAVAVLRRRPAAVVIGCDQVCALGDRLLGKPADAAEAVEQLMSLQGAEHMLATAVHVASDGREASFVDVSRLRMRPLARQEAERYVANDRPVGCAGGYRIESMGIALFEDILSADHTAIVGLPLLRLARELRSFGFSIP
ncbi:MAG: Maf family protein [Planctomycetota bacterium]